MGTTCSNGACAMPTVPPPLLGPPDAGAIVPISPSYGGSSGFRDAAVSNGGASGSAGTPATGGASGTGGSPTTGVSSLLTVDGPFKQIDVGNFHVCGLKLDGSLNCWGDNTLGQCDSPHGTFLQVSAGARHSCAVRADGTIACWGRNTFGESSPPDGVFTQVSAGGELADAHTCAIRVDGTVSCWGNNLFSQTTPPAGTFKQISAGYDHTCGLRDDGSVVCWGMTNGETPTGTFTNVSAGDSYDCATRSDGNVVCWGGYSYSWTVPPPRSFSQVAAAREHMCGLGVDGKIFCWGRDDEYGKIQPPMGTFSQISASNDQACALTPDGNPVCWGMMCIPNQSMCLSTTQPQTCSPKGTNESEPVLPGACVDQTCVGGSCMGDCLAGTTRCGSAGIDKCTESGKWTALSSCALGCEQRAANGLCHGGPPYKQMSIANSNPDHTCALRSNGMIDCWGANGSGQCDAPPSAFLQVACGGESSCALNADHAIVCWGREIGYGPPQGSFSQISMSTYRACAVKTDGTLACWGYSTDWKLPDGKFQQVSIDDDQACAIRSDGSIVCWDEQGSTPQAGAFVRVSTGGGYACALAVDGTITCWPPRNSPVSYGPAPTGKYAQISVGQGACGVSLDGVITCWANRSSFGVPEGSYSQIAVGYGQVCALTSDGMPTCWGSGCLPGSTRCHDKTHVSVCDLRYNWKDSSTCVKQACVDGACVGRCAPAETACSDNEFRTCSDSGEWTATKSCTYGCGSRTDGSPDCRECQPGDVRCNGVYQQSCGGDGFFADAQKCASACVGGQCVKGTCDYGQTRCQDSARLLVCGGDGTWGTTPVTCSRGCVSDDCAPPPVECDELASCCSHLTLTDRITCENVSERGTAAGCSSTLAGFRQLGACY
jgi:alpha-tubulin suppressor-like RCC1 family protein